MAQMVLDTGDEKLIERFDIRNMLIKQGEKGGEICTPFFVNLKADV
jgi:hypothetical protein